VSASGFTASTAGTPTPVSGTERTKFAPAVTRNRPVFGPTLVGVNVVIGGCVEGVVLGGAAGLGYAVATRRTEGGLAAPRGLPRIGAAAVTACACALGALALSSSGRPLVGGTIHVIAQASAGSHAMLTPLARLIGEPDFGPLSRAVIGAGEGALFGFGLALGLTRRPAARR